jgi:phosphohistidine phosphatase SixA
MNLYLLRHGDAIRDTRGHDSERPLSDLGMTQAATAGRYLRSVEADILLILCSPLLRARQTAAAVLNEIGPVPLQTSETLTSSSNPRHVVQELANLRLETILLIGHEPHLSTTISVLISGDERSKVLMSPCSLACVGIRTSPGDGKAVLHWLVHPEQMMGRRPD